MYFLSGGLILLFVACRGNGFDWNSYEIIYNTFHNGGERNGVQFVEYGYQWLCLISPSYRFLVLIVGIISIYLTLKGTFPFSKSNLPVLGLLIFTSMYMLGTYMGQVRQGLAMGCLCMAVWHNYEDKKKISLLWIGTGMLFHMTAILGIVILFTPKQKLNYWIYVGAIGISIIGYEVFLRIAAQFLGVSDSAAAQKAMVYAQSENEALSYSTVLLRIITLGLVLILNKQHKNKITYIANIYVWSIVIYLIFGFLPQLAGRGSYYFALYDMVLIPFIIKSFKKNGGLYLTLYLSIVVVSIIRVLARFQDFFYAHSFIPYFKY